MLGNVMPSEKTSDAGQSDHKGIKQHILPLLLAFVIPGFSLWFFDHAESRIDSDIRKELLDDVRRSSDLSEEDREAATEFYSKIKVSEIMASKDPEMAPLQELFEPAALRYATFRWCKRISMICLGATILALILVGAGGALSLRSQKSLYLSIRTGWPTVHSPKPPNVARKCSSVAKRDVPIVITGPGLRMGKFMTSVLDRTRTSTRDTTRRRWSAFIEKCVCCTVVAPVISIV